MRGNTHSRAEKGFGLSVSGVPTALPTVLLFDYLLLREELTQLLQGDGAVDEPAD